VAEQRDEFLSEEDLDLANLSELELDHVANARTRLLWTSRCGIHLVAVCARTSCVQLTRARIDLVDDGSLMNRNLCPSGDTSYA
jgi:hypothetical protein